MIIFGFIQGVFNTLGTIIGEISDRYGFTTVSNLYCQLLQDDAGLFGAVFIIGGIFGSAVFAIWVEIKKVYKLSVILISILSLLSTLACMFSFMSGLNWLTAICCFFVGFAMIPIMAVGFELGVECTFPIGESLSTGILMSAG